MSSPRPLLFVFVLGAVAGCAGPAAPRFSDTLVTDLRRIVDETHAETGVPSMALGVWVEGVGELTYSVGATVEGGQPIGFDEILRIGSITKTVTGTIILQLISEDAEGDFTLDTTVDRYFDGQVPGGDTITIRHLLAMQSGLASYSFNPEFQAALFGDPSRVWTPEEALEIAWADTTAGCPHRGQECFAAGTRMSYCNTNTVMLARIAEIESGRTYAQLVQERIAEPLGLTHTFQGTADGALPEPFVRGFTRQGLEDGADPQEATSWGPSWGFGVGDIASTLNELRVWGVALGSGSLLTPEMQAARIALQTVPPNTPDRAYLLGIGVEAGWYGHTGELPGYNTAVHYRPDIQAVVVTASNQDDAPGPASTLARRIHARLNQEVPLGTEWPTD